MEEEDLDIYQEEENRQEEGQHSEEEKKVEEQTEQKKRKKINRYRLKPDMLTDSQKGLPFLYKAFQKARFDTDSHFNEAKELDKFIHLMQEWHYLVMPKYDFHYFVDRCQKFGNGPLIRVSNQLLKNYFFIKSHMNLLRKAHKQLIPWETFNINSNTNDANTNPNIQNQPQQQEQIYQQEQQNDTFSSIIEEQPQYRQQNNQSMQSNRKPLKIKPRQSQIQNTQQPQLNQNQNENPNGSIINDDLFVNNLFESIEEAYKLRQVQKKQVIQ